MAERQLGVFRPMMAYSYATTGAVLGMGAAHTAIAAKHVDVAQQNADTYRQAVLQRAQQTGPQCADAEVRAACPLYQYREGLYRARCQDGSMLEIGLGRLLVHPPAVERPHPWQAEQCTVAQAQD